MEAPELLAFLRRWGLGLSAIFAIGILYPLPAKDYEISAHAALTNAIINAYNAAYPDNEIDTAYRFDLIRGAKEEDDGNRSLNHFYDPVRNRGLSFGGKTWMRSKSWATAGDVNDYTWQKGLDAYAREDYHRAFLILGHVLHLLEDASVPEHVRNDAHLLDSPYESFTKTLVPAAGGKAPLVLENLNAYFDAMATYANSGFYSADTIHNPAYPAPTPDYVAQEGKYLYGFKSDAEGNKYHLINYGLKNQKSIFDGDNNQILSDYWRLLSAKAVRYGAGMVRTFVAEGEKLKKETAATKKRSQSIYATLASVADVFSSAAESVDAAGDGLAEAETVLLEANAADALAVQDAASGTSAAVAASVPVRKTKAASAVPAPTKKTTVKTAPPKACAYVQTVTPTHGPVIINEVAWMGSKNSASDEWIELKNISGSPAVIAGWQVLSKRGNISAALPAGASIPAGGFYLLERTDDSAVPNVSADFVYVGSLANSDDGLRLLDANCKAADDVDGNPSWPAGNATGRLTMERTQDFSWHDYTGTGAGGIFGTPRAENSAPPAVKAGSASGGSSASSVSSGMSGASAQSAAAQTASAIQSVLVPPVQKFAKGDLVINEFLFDADGVDAGKEFVELYNPTDGQIRLAGWSLQVQSGAAGTVKKKNFDDGLSIPANGCFLAWLGTPPADARPHFVWSSGTLNNTAATIYVSAGTDEVSGTGDASVVDSIAYAVNAIPGFAPGMSAERVGEADAVRARQAPSPGSCVRLADDDPVPNGGALGTARPAAPPFTPPAITFGPNPDGPGARIDVKWATYPFVPETYPDMWTGIVFYLNHAPDGGRYLTTDNHLASGSSNALQLQYPIIRAGSFPIENMLVLPDVLGGMSTDNGLFSDAYNYYMLEKDGGAHATTLTEAKEGDYVTAGYYRFWGAGGGTQTMELVYADPTKIYFK